MKRVRVGDEGGEISVVLLEILENNLYHIILSLDDFMQWHSTCRFLRAFLREGFLGKYAQQFCCIALEKNEHFLKTRKHSSFYLSINKLSFLKQIHDAVDSVMGPIVFDSDQMTENSVFASCTLEAIGYKAGLSETKRKQLYHILEKMTSYIKEFYGWEFGVKRGGRLYSLTRGRQYDFPTHTDQCVLFLKKLESPLQTKQLVSLQSAERDLFSLAEKFRWLS